MRERDAAVVERWNIDMEEMNVSDHRDSQASEELKDLADFAVTDVDFEVEDLLEFVGEEEALDIIRMRYIHEDGEVKTSDIEERLLRSNLPERLRRILKRKLRAVREKLTRDALERIVRRAEAEYEEAKVEPNEAVGIVAAQSIGEPGTQMSLPGDERILIVERGVMRSERIGDFVDACISKYGAVVEGEAEICHVNENFFVLSLDNDGKLKWKNVKYVIRHEFDGELLRLRTKSGREITATPYHSFVTKKGGRIFPIAGSMLKPGERIPVVRRLPPLAVDCDCAISPSPETSPEASKRCVERERKVEHASTAYMLGRMFAENEYAFSFLNDDLLNGSDDFIKEFLRGFFAAVPLTGHPASDEADGEGCGDAVVNVRFHDRRVRDDFALLLARFGIFTLKSESAGDHLLLIPLSSFAAVFSGDCGCDSDEEDVVWDEIESIDFRRTSDRVYDISVDGLETFTTHDGIITHNTMRTFHYAGVGALYVTMGLPRIMEIMDARKKPSTPTMSIKLRGEYARSREKAEEIAAEIEETRIKDVARIEISLDEKCVFVVLKSEKLAELRIQREDIEAKIQKMDVNMEKIGEDILRIYPKEESYYELLRLEGRISEMLIKGIEGIKRVLVRKDKDGEYTLFTEGSALKKVMRIEGVDPTRTTTSNIIEIADVLGIEAARNAIIEEIISTLEDQNLDVDPRHISLIADAMTMDGEVKQIGRHGLAGEKASVLSRAAFEVTVEHLLEAALRGERDELLGITENVIVGQPIRLGTGAVELVSKIPMSRENTDRPPEIADTKEGKDKKTGN